jgi:hypothetical protein
MPPCPRALVLSCPRSLVTSLPHASVLPCPRALESCALVPVHLDGHAQRALRKERRGRPEPCLDGPLRGVQRLPAGAEPAVLKADEGRPIELAQPEAIPITHLHLPARAGVGECMGHKERGENARAVGDGRKIYSNEVQIKIQRPQPLIDQNTTKCQLRLDGTPRKLRFLGS